MLEAVRHDYWTPSDEVIESLASEYEQSVAENGAACCHHTCGNPLLHDFVSGMVSVPGYTEQIKAATKVETKDSEEKSSSSSSHHSSHSTGNATVVSQSSTSTSTSSNETSKSVSGDSDNNQTSKDSDTGYGTETPEPAPDIKKSADSSYVEGYEMQKDTTEEPESGKFSFSGSDIFGILFVLVALGGIYLGFYKKKM